MKASLGYKSPPLLPACPSLPGSRSGCGEWCPGARRGRSEHPFAVGRMVTEVILSWKLAPTSRPFIFGRSRRQGVAAAYGCPVGPSVCRCLWRPAHHGQEESFGSSRHARGLQSRRPRAGERSAYWAELGP